MNVALGTFGTGMPTKCPKCGADEGHFIYMHDGWQAKPQPTNNA